MLRSIRAWFWKQYRWRWLPIWYRLRYGVSLGYDEAMYPVLGKGEYVSVQYNGPYLEITNHYASDPSQPPGMIRLVPYQPNHGVMVEFIDADGKMQWRGHLDYARLYKAGAGAGEAHG